ncbi:hypothetical protein MKEN_01267100 [Mycena kentingensis (nom. inval.)]|nr:hypothetical protein MKEN_01267100 [Mycena kentingensis (nom. inval.)]
MRSLANVLPVITASSEIWGFTSMAGAISCSLVLVLIAILYTRSSTRPYLDRVSFRLGLYGLVSMMLHAIANAVAAFLTEPSVGCGLSVWVVMVTLQFTSWIMFGIGINLQLVVVHGVSGRVMEKYYIIGSAILALCVTVPAFAAHQYGWDPIYAACWMAGVDSATRLKWQLATQTLWALLATVGETISIFIVCLHLHRHRVMYAETMQSTSRSSSSHTRTDSTATHGASPSYAIQYRAIIIRVSFYPAVSIVINGLTLACDLYLSAQGAEAITPPDYNITLLVDLLYGLRPSIYAFLAASDPALLRAIRVAVNELRGIDDSDRTSRMSSICFDGRNSNGMVQSQSRPSLAVRVDFDGRQEPAPSERPYSRDFGVDKRGSLRLDAQRRKHSRVSEEIEEGKDFESQI